MSESVAGPKSLDPMELPKEERNPYPPPYDRALDGRWRRVIGDTHGLTRFGVNLTELEPGAVSALRHWHTEEDEFIYVVEGEPVLITEAGEEQLRPGMCACFPANEPNGHRLENRSGRTVLYLEVGNRSQYEEVHYPDSDMIMEKPSGGPRRFKRFDGSRY